MLSATLSDKLADQKEILKKLIDKIHLLKSKKTNKDTKAAIDSKDKIEVTSLNNPNPDSQAHLLKDVIPSVNAS